MSCASVIIRHLDKRERHRSERDHVGEVVLLAERDALQQWLGGGGVVV